MSPQKHKLLISLLCIAFVLAFGAGLSWYLDQQSGDESIDFPNWKVYVNETYNFGFTYPPSLKLWRNNDSPYTFPDGSRFDVLTVSANSGVGAIELQVRTQNKALLKQESNSETEYVDWNTIARGTANWGMNTFEFDKGELHFHLEIGKLTESQMREIVSSIEISPSHALRAASVSGEVAPSNEFKEQVLKDESLRPKAKNSVVLRYKIRTWLLEKFYFLKSTPELLEQFIEILLFAFGFIVATRWLKYFWKHQRERIRHAGSFLWKCVRKLINPEYGTHSLESEELLPIQSEMGEVISEGKIQTALSRILTRNGEHRQRIAVVLTLITFPVILWCLYFMINDIPKAGDSHGQTVACGNDQYIITEVDGLPPLPEDIRKGEPSMPTQTGFIYKNKPLNHNVLIQQDVRGLGWWYIPVSAPKQNCDRIYLTNIGKGHVYEGIYAFDVETATITKVIDDGLFNKELVPRADAKFRPELVSPDGEKILVLSHGGQGEGECNFRTIQSLNLRTGVATPVAHLSEYESLSQSPVKKQTENYCRKIDFGWKNEKEIYYDVFDASIGAGLTPGLIDFPYLGRKVSPTGNPDAAYFQATSDKAI